MKIMINGATSGTNFGDYLFAQMYQNHISKIVGKDNVCWFDNYFAYSEFYKSHLKNENSCRLKDVDALVYMPGGYFCGSINTLKNYLIVFWMYFKIGLKCIRRKKPIIILGMEVSHSKNFFIEKIQKKLMRKAKVVSVRNQQSYEVAKSYGVKNLYCLTDNVFAMEEDLYAHCEVSDEIKNIEGKKLFLHINPLITQNVKIKEKIVPIINKFLDNHPEYTVILGADQYYEGAIETMQDVSKEINTSKVVFNFYDNPLALCKVLSVVDTIVTTKLHVGIVGAKFGKSVISFSGHTEKIERLYEQLGEGGRTTPLVDLKFEKGVEMLELYHDKPIKVSDEIIEKAKLNFVLLDNFLEEIKNNKK